MKTIQKTFLTLIGLSLLALTGCGHNSSPGLSSPKSTPSKISVPGDGSPNHIMALSEQYSLSIGVDIRDVSRYKAALATEATTLIKAIKTQGKTFFPPEVRFLTNGATLSGDTQKNTVYGVEFEDLEVLSDGSKAATVNAFYHSDSGGFNFRTFNILFSSDGSQIKKVEVARDLPLEQTHFTIQLGLMQRKVILQDEEHNIRKIYPIGIGGFDMGVETMGAPSPLTPKIKMAVLEKSESMYSRTYPSYYAGRPFIRISSGVGGYTPFGLHYSITEELTRGFVSHGCIRLRDKDLYELYYILTAGSDQAILVEMRYWLKDLSDTPYPLDDSEYQRVKNFGTAENPETRRDQDNLVILEEKKGTPPEDSFVDNLARLMNLQ